MRGHVIWGERSGGSPTFVLISPGTVGVYIRSSYERGNTIGPTQGDHLPLS